MQIPHCLVYCRVKVNLKVVVLCVPSRVRLFVTPWTVAHQAPLSMEFFRQEYRSELPFPSPGECHLLLPDPGMEPESLASPAEQAGSLPLAPLGKPYLKA